MSEKTEGKCYFCKNIKNIRIFWTCGISVLACEDCIKKEIFYEKQSELNFICHTLNAEKIYCIKCKKEITPNDIILGDEPGEIDVICNKCNSYYFIKVCIEDEY